MHKIGVLIVDDDSCIIENLQAKISKEKDMEVIGTASTGYEGVLEAALLKPHILLIDNHMEMQGAGIYAAETLLKRFGHMKMIILIDREESEIIHTCLKSGIVDYVVKDESPTVIIQTIREAYNTIHPYEKDIPMKFYERNVHPRGIKDSLMYTLTVVSQLTPGELEIIKLLTEGYGIHDIAEIRNVSVDMIQNQTKRVLRKFSKKSTDELVEVLLTLNITEFLDHIV